MTDEDDGSVVTALNASVGLQRSYKSMRMFLDRVGAPGTVE
jgi:hypothetical protein